MPDLEAVGDAVTGGMLAGAVEPRTGAGADGHTHEVNCLNCGTALAGEYCHVCGQHAHAHRTLGAFWHDIAHGALHFEGKVWRTLPLLVWRPGELTRRYIRGQRARFVSPIALFLFSVFLMFAMYSLIGGPLMVSDVSAESQAEARRELAAEQAQSRREIMALQQELSRARATGVPTATVQSQIRAKQRELAVQESVSRLATGGTGTAEPRDAADGNSGPVLNIIGETGWPRLNKAIADAERNPSLLFYKLQTNAYKFSWLLIPISLPFVWLLFLHRGRYRREYGAYDHLIFVTYSIAFMSLGAIVLTLLQTVGASGAIIGLAATFIPPLHVYRQLRGAYELSRWSAAWRTVALMVCAFVALALFLLVLLILGVFG